MAGTYPALTHVDPARRRESQLLTLAGLATDIVALENAPDGYSRNIALGDRCLAYARAAADLSPQMPQPARTPQGAIQDSLAYRLREDRFVASHPDSRARLDQARAAFEQALAVAESDSQIGQAHQRLAVLECTLGNYRQALKHAERATTLAGEDGRIQRVRALCQAALEATPRTRTRGGAH